MQVFTIKSFILYLANFIYLIQSSGTWALAIKLGSPPVSRIIDACNAGISFAWLGIFTKLNPGFHAETGVL